MLFNYVCTIYILYSTEDRKDTWVGLWVLNFWN